MFYDVEISKNRWDILAGCIGTKGRVSKSVPNLSHSVTISVSFQNGSIEDGQPPFMNGE